MLGVEAIATILTVVIMLVGKQYLSKRDADGLKRVIELVDIDNKRITGEEASKIRAIVKKNTIKTDNIENMIGT